MIMKKLDFKVPFSGFASTTFINCFASAYLYMEELKSAEAAGTFCSEWENGSCNSCGNCATKPQALQERFFFLFDTMCGHSSLRCRFDARPSEMCMVINGEAENEDSFYDGGSENTVEFLFGFAGYSFETVTDKSRMQSAITASIDSEKPVIVKLTGHAVPFCLVTGYDGSRYLLPEFRAAQRCPDRAPTLDEIEAAYIFGEKTTPKYTLADGLKRIERVMDSNCRAGLWDEYMKKIGTYGEDSLGGDSPEGRKKRMSRLAQTMWHLFNCHNFAEVFRAYQNDDTKHVYDSIESMRALGGESFAAERQTIHWRFGYTHDLAWSIIGLDECINWSDWKAHYYGDMLEVIIKQLKENDEAVLEAIREMLKKLKQ